MRPALRSVLSTLAAVVAAALVVPRVVCGRGAEALYDGEIGAQRALADGVAEVVTRGVAPSGFSTGSARYDGEWTVATYQMATLGLGQVVLAHPELRARYLPAMRRACDGLVAPESLAFGAEGWGGEQGLDALDGPHGHAYLGYVNLALGMLRVMDPHNRHAALHDRLTEALARRVAASPTGLIETYPGETFPADVSAVVGSLGLHARATGRPRDPRLARWTAAFRGRFVDRASGYVVQSVTPAGRAVDAPRGSGTAVAAYFLSFADAALARDLYRAVARRGRASLLGFAAVREYPAGHVSRGDIDSGPVVAGVSVSATGFALAAARQHGDRDLYVGLYRTAHLFGVPVTRGGATRFVSGGPLGNAILLAMLTARRP